MKTIQKLTPAATSVSRSVVRVLVLTLALAFTLPSHAQQDPQKVISQAVETLLSEFVANRSELEADKAKFYRLVNQRVVPHFDMVRISKLVLAKNYRKASPKQRADFTEEFKNLLVNTYANALFLYSGEEKITFTGSEIKERKGRKFATVTSAISLGDGGQPVEVKYDMLLSKDGKWRIYNLTVAGINMVTNYRSTYAAAVKQQGLDGVIATMREKNAENN